MQKLVLLAAAFLIVKYTPLVAQPAFDYDAAWKKVEHLQQKEGLSRSAETELLQIYQAAKREKNAPQMIKALVYRVNLWQQREDDALIKAIRELEKELTFATGATQAILQSILAEAYWHYLQQNRWRLYDRTHTVQFVQNDIRTWSLRDLHQKIAALYEASLQNNVLLQQTRLDFYEALLQKGNTRTLRPTLYDLLAHRALDYFENDERTVTEPAYAFRISDSKAFDPVNDFIQHRFATADTNSLHYRALEVYRQLLSFRVLQANTEALIDADLRRIAFVYQHSTYPQKIKAYRAVLNHLLQQYHFQPVVSNAAYLLARSYADEAATYNPQQHKANDSLNPRYLYQKAAALCRQVLQQDVLTEGKVNCQLLLRQIEQKEISITGEAVVVPEQPFRILLSYRNMPQVWIRIIAAPATWKDASQDTSFWQLLINAQPLATTNFSLPAADDHQPHKTELPLPSLKAGRYVILASATPNFERTNNLLAAFYMHCSNIAWMQQQQHLFVVHRETGQPLPQTRVNLWKKYYDYGTRSYQEKMIAGWVTDAKGYCRLPATKEEDNYYSLQVIYKNDTLHLNQPTSAAVYHSANNNKSDEKRRSFLFTDRSIYRPGQTLYFKGIITRQTGKNKYETVAGKKVMLVLYDANSQPVDSLLVTSNGFGSYAGNFTLPTGLLNGHFYLQENDTYQRHYFTVEAYKRPQFYVQFEPTKGSFRIHDTVTVTGLAQAYAGFGIDGAQVRYRVTRETRLPFPWLCYRWGWPRLQTQEVAQGETGTDVSGKFTLQFPALPNPDVRSELLPVYSYTVTADVTDRNGETRSQTSYVQVGSTSVLVSIALPQGASVAADRLRNIEVKVTNQMDVWVSTPVTVTVHRLQAPERLIRNRYWDVPDQFVISESEFRKRFPYDPYHEEAEKENWPRGTEVFRQNYTTSDTNKLIVQLQQPLRTKWQPGWYVIEATVTDEKGVAIKNQAFLELTHPVTGAPGHPQYVWYAESNNITAQPGDTVRLRTGSSADNVWMIEIPQNDSSAPVQYHMLSNNSKTIPLYITEADRGGTGRSFAFVRHNRFYAFDKHIAVPWSNKELDISLTTWRNTLTPGSKETWTVTIKGPKGDKIAAELLTTLYDASLDAFQMHNWQKPNLYPTRYWYGFWNSSGFHSSGSIGQSWIAFQQLSYNKTYDQLYTLQPQGMYMTLRGDVRREAMAVADNTGAKTDIPPNASQPGTRNKSTEETIIASRHMPAIENAAGTRTDFRETAFFFPQLQTDSSGNIRFSFSMPEALTRWKWLLLAHTTDLSFGLLQQQVITQKEIMVQPFAPRFLREGDRFAFTAKIINQTNEEQTGVARLQLLNAATLQPVDGWFQNAFPEQYFTVGPRQSTVVQFRTEVPYNFNEALTYRITATAGKHSDGEERTLPVLTNRTLVTESLPLTLQGGGTRNFKMESLLQSAKSETLTHHRFTVEFTTNPVWYAVQALPYLMEQPDENAMQLWNRFYANALALHIVEKLPRIRNIFERWQATDTAALLSNLQKNESLKNALLQETPWVLQARNESEQKKQVALLFNLVRMAAELQRSLQLLQQYQTANGGFMWLKGGPDDRYITQYILSGIGHLKQLNALPNNEQHLLHTITQKAITYLDLRIKDDYAQLQQSKIKLQQPHINNLQIQYLYLRSFYTTIPVTKGCETAFRFYLQQGRTYWLQQPRYLQGMLALALHRSGNKTTATAIVRSLEENAIHHAEMGMYWKEWNAGYYWYQAPIEAQALMIEVFHEVAKDQQSVNALKTWLLRQKQVQHWRSSRATAEACYALLLQGTQWMDADAEVTIKAGNQIFQSLSEKTETGTGYFQRSLPGHQVVPELGNIQVTVRHSTAQPGWGAAYWQYFENLDQIQNAHTSLQLEKKYFVKQNTPNGPVLMPYEDGDVLQVGDRIVVRLVLRTDRNLEYVHLKDMRPSCLEPVDVISGYRWQNALGYYQSVNDASTNFYIGWMPRGTYVWEYELTATHAGNYSSGIATLQCLYAPEFSSHSEGIRMKVEPR
jgi:uncharacterized protein YfaS (alpha-2-macroglobulin family)